MIDFGGYGVLQSPQPDRAAEDRLAEEQGYPVPAADQDTLFHSLLSCGSDLTEAEKWVVKWQLGILGGFQMALARAMVCADDANLERLRLGFPDQVAGLLAWRHGDLRVRLVARGLDV